MEQKKIQQLAALLSKAKKIACLTGAGMSTESGIPDFRSPNGLYKTITSEEVFDIQHFRVNPQDFYKIIGPLYCSIVEAKPNPGHIALAELENRCGKNVKIATQNIDGLHQKAGSQHVYEVHGTMATLTCTKCGRQYDNTGFLNQFKKCQVIYCDCGHVLKPDITFFGESLPEDAFQKSMAAFENADLALVMGTSLTVYPAAYLPSYRRNGIPLAILNRTATDADNEAALVINDPVGQALPAAVAMLSKET